MGGFNFDGMQMPDPNQEPGQGGNESQAGETGAAAGPDLGGLLGGLLGGAGAGGGPGAAGGAGDLSGLLGALLSGGAGAGGAGGLAGLLAGLLGGGAGGLNTGGLAAQTGLPPALIQAALPLVIGALAGGRQGRSAGIDVAAPGGASQDLAGLLQSGAPIDSQALHATGLPQQLSQQTGASHAEAASAIQSILAALTGRIS